MKQLNYTTFVKKPALLVRENYNYQEVFIVNIESENIVNEIGVKVWRQSPVEIGNNLSYENIIAAIVEAKYSNDDVTAITLNYLLAVHNEVDENKQEEYINEYRTLQAWRQKAKGIAKEVLEFAQKQNMI